jgi:hypothetical protein
VDRQQNFNLLPERIFLKDRTPKPSDSKSFDRLTPQLHPRCRPRIAGPAKFTDPAASQTFRRIASSPNAFALFLSQLGGVLRDCKQTIK